MQVRGFERYIPLTVNQGWLVQHHVDHFSISFENHRRQMK